MKKIYESPKSEKIELTTLHLVAVSIPAEPNTYNNGDKWANEYDVNEHRGAWDDIWSYME